MADLNDFDEYGGDDGGGNDATSTAESDADDEFETVETTPTTAGDGIGTIAVSQGLRIHEDEEDSTVRAYVTKGNRSSVRIGKYLLAPYPDGETLFCRIAGLEYAQEFHADDATEIHARRAMAQDGIDEADYKFLADLEPMAVLYDTDGDLKRRMTDRVPKPQTTIREADDTSEIKTGLKIPEDGVFLGHLAVGGEKVRTSAQPPTIDYRLNDDYEDGDPLVFRHTLIAGGTGSGKTHSAKNVLRQFLADERTYRMDDGRSVTPAVVQFDPQDEYAQMHDDNDSLDQETARRYEREGVVHGGHDDTIAFVPKVGNATYATDDHRAEQVEFTIPFSMVRDNEWLVAEIGRAHV